MLLFVPPDTKSSSMLNDCHHKYGKGNVMATSNSTTLLLIDDEPMMISVIGSMLEYLNCRVLQTVDVDQALDIYAKHKTEIDLVLVDQMMPKMTGITLAKKLYDHDPNVKIVLMTGSSIEDFEARDDIEGISAFLQKPFSFDDLERMVENEVNVRA